MRHEIDQDRAIAMAPPPRPFVDPDGLQRGGVGHGGRSHQPEQGGWTGGELQAGRQPHAGLPTEGDTDRLQDHDESWRVPGVWRDEFWEALREDAARAVRLPADEFPDHQVEAHHTRSPGEVG